MSISLFDSTTLGDLTLKNRIVMAPMTRGRAGDSRIANDLMAEHYAQRAEAGLLITEATVVSTTGIGWIGWWRFPVRTARIRMPAPGAPCSAGAWPWAAAKAPSAKAWRWPASGRC